jgi:hypothetical protein
MRGVAISIGGPAGASLVSAFKFPGSFMDAMPDD